MWSVNIFFFFKDGGTTRIKRGGVGGGVRGVKGTGEGGGAPPPGPAFETTHPYQNSPPGRFKWVPTLGFGPKPRNQRLFLIFFPCFFYTSEASDDLLRSDFWCRLLIKKKTNIHI